MNETDGDWPYFPREEIACKCGHCDGGQMEHDFMTRLVALRHDCGFPFPVSSAYRCPAHNAAEGGAKGSYHMDGKAIDIRVSHEQAMTIMERARKHGFTGVGVKQKGRARFIHLDTRPSKFTLFSY